MIDVSAGSPRPSSLLRRRSTLFATVTVFGALSLLASACGGGTNSNGSAPSAGTINPNGVLRYGVDLNIGFDNTFDPAQVRNDCAFQELSQIYSSVTGAGAPPSSPSGSTEVSPGVAESWQVQGTDLTLNIRPNAHFSDGALIDANAVKASINHIATSPLRTSLLEIQSMDVVNPTTLVIHLKAATAGDLLSALSFLDGAVMNPAAYATAGTQPVSSGPFVLSHYQQGSSIQLTPNPKFWNSSLYKLGGVNFTQVSVGPSTTSSLRSGAVDMVDLQPNDVASVQGQPNIGVSITRSSQYVLLQLRVNQAPFNNTAVRSALEYSFDRSTINRVTQNGLGQPAYQPFPSWQAGYNASIGNSFQYQPAKAKAMLASAGFPNGVSFNLVIPAGVTSYSQTAQIMQQEMAAAGFHVNIQQVSGGDLFTSFYLHGSGDAVMVENGATGPDIANNFLSSYTSVGFIAKSLGSVNPQITALTNQAIASVDPSVQGPPMQQASQIVMQQGLEVPIVFVPEIVAYNRTTVGGNPQAPYGFCKANLAGIYMKK
jgi:peptide/nickel transport system substrate-binding protein